MLGRAVGRIEGHEAGKVRVFRAQAVERPGSQRGTHELEAAGVHLGLGLWVVWQVGVHSPEQAEVIGMTGDIGHELRNP